MSVGSPLCRLVMALLVTAVPSAAHADWLLTGHIGRTFAGRTTHLDPEQGATSSQVIYGVSVGWLGRGVFGVEADLGYAPRFFERDSRAGLVTGSNVTTLTGNVLVAMPVSVTRESLRPYLVAGVGLLHSGATDLLGLGPEFDLQDRDVLGLGLGGGAIGFLTPDTGVRFELRHLRSVFRGENPLTGQAGTQLRFWRATVGVTFSF